MKKHRHSRDLIHSPSFVTACHDYPGGFMGNLKNPVRI